jgi:hypothetical protein
MDGYENVVGELKKSMEKLQSMNRISLEKIKEQHPEKVAELLKDNKSLMDALKNQDLQAVLKIQEKYANKINK